MPICCYAAFNEQAVHHQPDPLCWQCGCLRRPSDRQASAAPVPTVPPVSSNRVMEGQITYFDGSMLGLLVQARPVK